MPLEITITFPLFPFSLFSFPFLLPNFLHYFSFQFSFYSNLLSLSFLYFFFISIHLRSLSPMQPFFANPERVLRLSTTTTPQIFVHRLCSTAEKRVAALCYVPFLFHIRKITYCKKLKFVRRETRGKDSILFNIEQLLPTKFSHTLYKSHFFFFFFFHKIVRNYHEPPTFSLNELLHNRKITQSRWFEKPFGFRGTWSNMRIVLTQPWIRSN